MTGMRYLTTEQMREADRRCIEEIGIPSVVLMDRAGEAVAREIRQGPVVVFCGKGNNGGDGFVAARYALTGGFDVRVALIADPAEVSGDPAIFKQAYENLGGVVTVAQTEDAVKDVIDEHREYGVAVDALLGTGITGDVRGPIGEAIKNWPKIHTVAVDVPSGLNGDTGEPCGAAVTADVTVTFQFAKAGYEKNPAKPYLGRLVVADIGIPEICGDDDAWAARKKGG